MRKYRHPLRWGLSVFALTTTAAMGIGAGVATTLETDEASLIQPAIETVEVKSGLLDEAVKNKLRVEQEVGASCLKLIHIYLPGGKLAGTPEDTSVNDILNTPGVPCGQTLTDVRIAYRGLANVNTAVTTSESDLLNAQNNLTLTKELEHDSDVPEALIFTGIVGAIIGGGIGFVTAMELDINNPPKPGKD